MSVDSLTSAHAASSHTGAGKPAEMETSERPSVEGRRPESIAEITLSKYGRLCNRLAELEEMLVALETAAQHVDETSLSAANGIESGTIGTVTGSFNGMLAEIHSLNTGETPGLVPKDLMDLLLARHEQAFRFLSRLGIGIGKNGFLESTNPQLPDATDLDASLAHRLGQELRLIVYALLELAESGTDGEAGIFAEEKLLQELRDHLEAIRTARKNRLALLERLILRIDATSIFLNPQLANQTLARFLPGAKG